MIIQFKRDGKVYEVNVDKVLDRVHAKSEQRIDNMHSGLVVDANTSCKYGFVNQNAEVVIEHQYDQVRPFREGRAAVKLNDKWGVIDTNGQVIVPFIYTSIKSFKQGFAQVSIGDAVGYIDELGTEVLECKYFNLNNGYPYVGLFLVGMTIEKEAPYKENVEYIDITGTQLLDYLSEEEFEISQTYFGKEKDMDRYYSVMAKIAEHCYNVMVERAEGNEEKEMVALKFYKNVIKLLKKEKTAILNAIEEKYAEILTMDEDERYEAESIYADDYDI